MKNKVLKNSLNIFNSALVVLIVGSILSVAYIFVQKSSPKIHNSVGVNQQINYQGRLLTSTGAVVPDGTYNIEFKISQDGDGVLGGGDETLKWTETRTGGNKVQVKNGYFSVYLGAITAFGTSVDWNQDTLWLSINIGGTGSPSWDGEMTPFTRFSSTPYSLNSRALDGLTSDNFVKLAQGAQADASTTNSSIFINKTGATSNILQLQKNALDVLVIANDGSATFKNASDSSSAFLVKNLAGTDLIGVNTLDSVINLAGGNNPSLRSWASTSGLGVDKSEGGFVTSNGYIYAVGSGGSAVPSSAVYYTKIKADGTLGTWTTTSSLANARWGNTAVVGSGYIYAIGGNDGGSALDSVEYAKINPDGTLGTWNSTSGLGTPRYRSGAISVNGYIYAIGTPGSSSVEYAKINADGTLGTWTSTSSLTGSRYGHAVVSANGYVYAIGGNNGSDLATVESAVVNSDGTLGTWTSNTSMGTAQNIVSGVAVNGNIYVVGGCGGAGCPSTQVQYASIGNNGTLGTWGTTSILGTARYGNGTVVANGYIYTISGSGTTTVEYTSIERVRIGAALDLVGLAGGNLTDGQTGVGGELTAGNTKIIGGLDVQGQVSLARSLSVGSDITVGGTTISGSSDLTLRSGGVTTLNLIGDGGVYIDSSSSGQIYIGTQGTLQDVNIGNPNNSSATRIWAGTSGVIVQPGGSTNTAFQIKNTSNVTLFGVDTNNSRIFSDVADGASAVGLRFNTNNSFSTSGAKLFSLQNNGSEKFFVDKDGLVNGQGGLTISGGTANINTSANSTSIGNGSSILTLTGSSSSTIVFGGTTISASELNLLDGHNVALVDTDDGVATAITGTGILGAGSIASGFGAIDVGNDGITTTGTIGTAGSTTFTGSTLTLTGALAANGGITFNNSTDTLGAFTLAGTLDASTQLITNIGNAGTDFTSAGGLNLASDLSVTGDAFASHRFYVPGLSGTNGQGFFTGTSSTTLGGLQSLDLAGNTYTFFGNNKYFNGSAWVDSGLSRTGASFQIQNDSFTFYSFDTGTTFTPRFTVASGGNVGVGLSGAPSSLFSVGGTTGNFLVNNAGAATTNGGLIFDRSNARFTNEADPSAPTVAVNVTAGNLNGTYSYCVTFVTAQGESDCGTVSSSVAPVSQQVNLSTISTGTANVVTARKVYRAKAFSGGTTFQNYQLVTTINDNTTTTYTDNIADGSVGALAPFVSSLSGLGITSNAASDLVLGGGPWVDARAFGAKCDNVTDDTTAIQTAINSVARTGGTVLLPIGQCIISTTLTINDSTVTLKGQGAYGNDDISAFSSKGTAIIAGPSWTAANPLVKVTPPATGATKPAIKRISISNINFECAGRADYGLQLISTQYSSIRDLYFRNCSKVNLDLDTMAGTLGEATDTTRNEFSNIQIRTIDSSLVNTTINGAGSLPTGTITVVSTTGFNAGANSLAIFVGQSTPQYVSCTGTTATTFTGCTGGTGTLAVGQRVAVYGPGSAAGIRLNGSPSASPAGNTSVNSFNNIQILYGHGTAIMFDNSDSNRFYGASLNRGNNTGIGVEFGAGTSAADSSRANVFYAFDQGPPGSSSAPQVVARGTQSSTVAAQNNQFFGFSRENGTALPTIENGAILYLVTDRDYESRVFSNNFGSLMAGGAFISNTSMLTEEWNVPRQITAATADSINVVGDDATWYFDTTSTTSTYQTPADVVNGYARLTFGTTSGVGGLIGFGEVQNDLQRLVLKANLPVVQMKIRPSINSTTNDIFWGMSDQATAPTANDTKPANGMYFWNNNAAGGWQGVVRSGAVDVGTVTCPGAISTTQFAVGRIQVESATSVRFLIDNDSSDGVSFTDCGVVSGANPTAALGLMVYNTHTETTGGRTLDIDYIRMWQDDSPELAVSESAGSSGEQESGQGLDVETESEPFDARIALADMMTSADSVYDPSRRLDVQTLVATGGIVSPDITTDKLSVNNIEVSTGSDINIKLSEDGKFVMVGADGEQKITFDGQGNANFTGTITADKIKASQIEGLEVFTNRISAVPSPSSQSQPESETTETQTNNTQAPAESPVEFGNITINSAVVTLNLGVNGTITTAGLTVNGPAEFHGNTTFYKLVTFVEKTVFSNDIDFVGRATFNNDTAGFAVIQPGQTQVHVDFTRPYDQLPVVTLSVKNGQFVQYAYKDLTNTGFTIVIEQPTATPVEFSWNALSIKNPRTTSNP